MSGLEILLFGIPFFGFEIPLLSIAFTEMAIMIICGKGAFSFLKMIFSGNKNKIKYTMYEKRNIDDLKWR